MWGRRKQLASTQGRQQRRTNIGTASFPINRQLSQMFLSTYLTDAGDLKYEMIYILGLNK